MEGESVECFFEQRRCVTEVLGRATALRLRSCISILSDTWELNALKHYLGDSGDQARMQGNTFLHEIFDVELEEKRVRVCDLKLSSVEKRMLYSPNAATSKARTKALNRTRLQIRLRKQLLSM